MRNFYYFRGISWIVRTGNRGQGIMMRTRESIFVPGERLIVERCVLQYCTVKYLESTVH